MPPIPILPLINTGISAASSILNPLFQAQQNKKNQQFAEHMYNTQRADALADREFQNQYNSPAAQMERLKAAGLNPNLVYGNGNAVQQSAQTRSSDFSTPKTEAPQLNFQATANAIMMGEQIKQMQVQTDNLKASIKLAEQEAALKAAQTFNTFAATDRTKVGTQMDEFSLNKLMPANLEQAQANFNKTLADINKTNVEAKTMLSRDERETAMNSANLQTAAVNVLKMRAETAKTQAEKSEIYTRIKNIQADTKIKQLDADLKSKGIQPHDALWQRKVAEFVNDVKFTPKDIKAALQPSFMYNIMKSFFN